MGVGSCAKTHLEIRCQLWSSRLGVKIDLSDADRVQEKLFFSVAEGKKTDFRGEAINALEITSPVPLLSPLLHMSVSLSSVRCIQQELHPPSGAQKFQVVTTSRNQDSLVTQAKRQLGSVLQLVQITFRNHSFLHGWQ